jgi:hypothetical protein
LPFFFFLPVQELQDRLGHSDDEDGEAPAPAASSGGAAAAVVAAAGEEEDEDDEDDDDEDDDDDDDEEEEDEEAAKDAPKKDDEDTVVFLAADRDDDKTPEANPEDDHFVEECRKMISESLQTRPVEQTSVRTLDVPIPLNLKGTLPEVKGRSTQIFFKKKI